MLINTTRFGPLEVDGDRIITFRDGLLGFPHLRRYALIQTSSDPVFFLLQSLDDPDIVFVVCDPRAFVPDYQVPIRHDDLELLQLQNLQDCQVLIVVNKVGDRLTGNLLGPLVIGAGSLLGKQFVLSEKQYRTRHLLTRIPQPMPVAKTA
jgi:flagellar assembly factor FliW